MLSSMKDIVNSLSKLQRRPVTTLRNADNLILLPQFESLLEPPRVGWYKVNVDGAIFSDSGSGGAGVVIKNEKGQLMGRDGTRT